ncbi:MAG: ATP phosphoribosyltransferase, partial [Acidimicrobiales bacterium]
PVRILVAAPAEILESGQLPKRSLVVASEYERLAGGWIAANGLDASFVRSYGATEVLPPEDADVIVDNSATGETLAANGLVVVDELLTSSTRLYASREACADPVKLGRINDFVLSLSSVLEARKRAMLELNVSLDDLDAMIAALPSMREPTVAMLHGGTAMAVKAAVPRGDLPRLIPLLKGLGASDIVVSTLEQIVP